MLLFGRQCYHMNISFAFSLGCGARTGAAEDIMGLSITKHMAMGKGRIGAWPWAGALESWAGAEKDWGRDAPTAKSVARPRVREGADAGTAAGAGTSAWAGWRWEAGAASGRGDAEAAPGNSGSLIGSVNIDYLWPGHQQPKAAERLHDYLDDDNGEPARRYTSHCLTTHTRHYTNTRPRQPQRVKQWLPQISSFFTLRGGGRGRAEGGGGRGGGSERRRERYIPPLPPSLSPLLSSFYIQLD